MPAYNLGQPGVAPAAGSAVLTSAALQQFDVQAFMKAQQQQQQRQQLQQALQRAGPQPGYSAVGTVIASIRCNLAL